MGFQNIVGTPKIDYSWNSDNISFGQSIVLNVKIFGDANLDSLERVITTQFNDFNIFESLKSTDEKVENGEYFEIFSPYKDSSNINDITLSSLSVSNQTRDEFSPEILRA